MQLKLKSTIANKYFQLDTESYNLRYSFYLLPARSSLCHQKYFFLIRIILIPSKNISFTALKLVPWEFEQVIFLPHGVACHIVTMRKLTRSHICMIISETFQDSVTP